MRRAGDLDPPGISGRSNADNFARPLFATGFASTLPFDPGDGREPGLLLRFDYDHPASKLRETGTFVVIDVLPDGSSLYLELFELDTEHGFAHCARQRP